MAISMAGPAGSAIFMVPKRVAASASPSIAPASAWAKALPSPSMERSSSPKGRPRRRSRTEPPTSAHRSPRLSANRPAASRTLRCVPGSAWRSRSHGPRSWPGSAQPATRIGADHGPFGLRFCPSEACTRYVCLLPPARPESVNDTVPEDALATDPIGADAVSRNT